MVLIIGGDHLGSIAQNLRSLGYDSIHHVKGRTEKRVEIPTGTDLVVVLIDYVNHNLAKWVKEHAKARNLPIIFSRRSWSAICQSLQSCTSCPNNQRCPGSTAAV